MEADRARHQWSSRSIQLHHQHHLASTALSQPPSSCGEWRRTSRQTHGKEGIHTVSVKIASLPRGDSIALRGKRRAGLPSSRCMLANQQRHGGRGTGEPTAFRRTVPLFRCLECCVGGLRLAGWASPLADVPSEPGLSQLGLWLSHLSCANHKPSFASAKGTYLFLPQAKCPFRNTWPKDKSTRVSHLLPCPSSRCLLRQHLAICPLDTRRSTPTIRFYLESPPTPPESLDSSLAMPLP